MHDELMIRFAQAVAHTLWQGLVVGLLAWLLLRLFRKRPARQHGVLCGALLVMALCLPVNVAVLSNGSNVSALAGQGESAEAESRKGEADLLMAPTGESPKASESVAEFATRSDELPEDQPVVAAAPSGWRRASPWVAGGYVAGLLAMLARLGFAWRGGRRLRKRARAVRNDRWLDSFDKALARLAMKTKPALRWSEVVAAPVLIGLTKPMILLPVALVNRLTLAQAEAVLAHELAHLRRCDHWVLAGQRLVETVLFYHPAVWWLSRELNRTREEACDDLVLKSGAQPADYAEALVLCSECRLQQAGLADGAAMQLAASGTKGSSLRNRVMRVLGKDEAIRPGKAGWWMVGVVAAFAVIVVAGAVPEKGQDEDDDLDGSLGENGSFVRTELAPLHYSVQAGDTFAMIAKKFELTVGYLRNLNPGLGSAELREGQELVVGHSGTERHDGEPDHWVTTQMVVAEVPAGFVATPESVTVEALQGQDEAVILATPVVMVWSGQEAELAIAEGRARDSGDGELAIVLRPEYLNGDVDFSLRIARSEAGERGAVYTQQLEVNRSVPSEKREAFEISPLDEGRKLVGSVKFLVVTTPAGVRRQEADPVFYLRQDRRVRWRGELYSLEDLKAVLPEKGEGPVFVEAGEETPYRRVVKLMEVLVPVFGEEVKVRVAEEEEAEEELDSDEVQLAQCRLDLRQMETERAELLTTFANDHPRVRTLNRRIETAKEFIRELEARRAEDQGQTNPLVRELLQDAAQSSPAPSANIERMIRLRVTETELAERQRILDELRADGFGAQHPKVVTIQQRIEELREELKELRDGVEKAAPEAEGDHEEKPESNRSRDGQRGFVPEPQFNPQADELDELVERTRFVVSGPEGARTEGIVPEVDLSGFIPAKAPQEKRPYFALGMAERIKRAREATPEGRDEDEPRSPVRRVRFQERNIDPDPSR